MIQQLGDAAMAGDAETVRRLLASLMLASDYTNEGWTALHPAVANGRVETARMLLRAGAAADARTGDAGSEQRRNKTPLALLAVEDRTGEGGTPVSPEVDSGAKCELDGRHSSRDPTKPSFAAHRGHALGRTHFIHNRGTNHLPAEICKLQRLVACPQKLVLARTERTDGRRRDQCSHLRSFVNGGAAGNPLPAGPGVPASRTA